MQDSYVLEAEMGEKAFEVNILVKIIAAAKNAGDLEAEVKSMSVEDIGAEIDNGEWIGQSQVVAVEEIKPGQLEHRLMEIGNDGEWPIFEEMPVPDADIEYAGPRVLAARKAAGWPSEEMHLLALRFISEAGLENAYAAFLEDRAGVE